MSSLRPDSSAAEPPSDSADVRVTAAAQAAGGLSAIRETIKHVQKHTGLRRGIKALLQVNQPAGFDCPGCAWPDPRDDASGGHSAIEFCENGAKAVAWEATTKCIGADFFAQHSLAALSERSDYWLGQAGRMSEPLWCPPGHSHYQPISYEAAFARIADTLCTLDSPDQAAFYTSGRTSNEAAFLYQLFVRLFGTNNLPDCSDLCHESSGVAMREALGVGKGTVQLEDFALCDAIFIIGQNPGTNHPRMLSTLQAAAERGSAIVSINPLAEAALTRFAHPQNPLDLLGSGTAISRLHLPVRLNGDAALFKGMMKELLAEEKRHPGTVLDWPFIREHTSGFDAFCAALNEISWEQICEDSGLTRTQIRAAAEVALQSPRIICCWAMGLTQHKEAVATIQEVLNFLLLRGNIGRPGSGACPVRGHSNVQGDRTVGITEHPDPAFLQRLGRRFEFAPPLKDGLDTVGTIAAMADGQVQVFLALGGNFLSASPDTEQTAAALRRCRLTVHVSTKLHRGHLVVGKEAIILPCLGRSEIDMQATGPQIVSVENSMGIVHASRGVLNPVHSGLKSEVAIVCGIANATFAKRPSPAAVSMDWEALTDNYDVIRDHIAEVVLGFENYNQRLRSRDGFLLPNAARQRRFQTASGRAQFSVHPLPKTAQEALLPGQLLMMTVRSHDQFNTTIYGLDDRYRGIAGGRRVILMNAEDIAERGLVAGQHVDLCSHFRQEKRLARDFVVVPYAIPRRCTATYFPEANVLVPLNSYADKSRTPTSKSVVITVIPAQPARFSEDGQSPTLR